MFVDIDRVTTHSTPHFYVYYGQHYAAICIDNSEILYGSLPVRAREIIAAWVQEHRGELLRNWIAINGNMSSTPIEPLD